MRYSACVLILCLLSLSPISRGFAADEENLNVLIGNEVRDIASDTDDVWIATDKGVTRYHRATKTWSFLTIADGLISNNVRCISLERRFSLLGYKPGERVWFGTDSGVSLYNKRTGRWRSFTKSDGLLENDVRAISATGKEVWILTPRGVSVYNVKRDTWTTYTSFPGIRSARLTCIYHDSHYAWIGTTDGLIRYNKRRKRALNAPARVKARMAGYNEVRDRWEFFARKLSEWIDPTGGSHSSADLPIQYRCPFPDTKILSIDGDSGYVYIATRSGLVRYDLRFSTSVRLERTGYGKMIMLRQAITQSRRKSVVNRELLWRNLGWTFFQPTERLPKLRDVISDEILDISVSRGHVWCATPRGLLHLDSKSESLELITREKGFPDTQVNAVSVWGNQVWAGTPHGVAVKGLMGKGWVLFRMERALPSNYVTAVKADHKWIWFGTKGAVSRFNPSTERWQTYTRDDGLAGDRVNSIAVVGNFVWVATDEGISRINKYTGEIDHFGSKTTKLPTDNITTILVDGRYVWVGSAKGLTQYDKVARRWVLFSDKLPDAHVNALIADPTFLWVGTEGGLVRYDKADDLWERVSVPEVKRVLALASNSTYLFMACPGVLYVWDRKKLRWKNYRDGIPLKIRSLAADEKGVWMGTRGGVIYLDMTTGKRRVFGDSDAKGLSRADVFDAVSTDRYVWFGTDIGVYRYDRMSGKWWVYSPNISRGETHVLIDSNVQAIAHNKYYVYFGTPLGISRLDKFTGSWMDITRRDGLPEPDVRRIVADGLDIWVATPHGVEYYDHVADEWTLYTHRDGLPSDEILDIDRGEDAIWIGTPNGAAVFDKGKGTWRRITEGDGLPDRTVRAVAVDGDNVWFGTPKGVAVLNIKLNSWDWFTEADGLVSDDVRSIYIMDPYVLIGSSKGTTIYDKDLGTFSPFSKIDGLRDNLIRAFDFGRNYAWFGTSFGLTLYDLVRDLPAEQFTSENGLPGDNVQAISVDSPFVWIGTDSGLARYDWDKDVWTLFRSAPRRGRETRSAELLSPNVKSLAEVGDYLFVGTRLGLSLYDKRNGTWERIQLPGIFSIRSIAPDGRFLWIGTHRGLALYDTASKELVRINLSSVPDIIRKVVLSTRQPEHYAPVRDIEVTRGGVWFLCPDQLIHMYREAREDIWVSVHGSLRVEMVNGVARTKKAPEDLGIRRATSMAILKGQIWIGRDRGLTVYDPKRHRKVDIAIPKPLEGIKVTDIAEDEDGSVLWIGTRNGLFRYQSGTSLWKRFTVEDGLVSPHVSAIAVDGRFVWVGTSDKGVSRYDKESGKWRSFQIEDGLADHNIRDIVVDKRYVWFGTFSAGVCRYDKRTGLWTRYLTAGYRTAAR